MANSDSFIDEVSEELRRDRLYALFRKWGWIPVLVVLAIVGGAAYFEWQRAQQEASAQAFGNAILDALDGDDPAARAAALEDIAVEAAEAQVIIALLAAGEAATAGDPVDAAARLRAAAEAPGLDQLYAHLALLKAQMLDPAPEDEARLVLEGLAAPGAPFAALAEEQLALVDVRAGNIAAAIDRLRAIERSAAATAGLQQRAAQLIVALESGAVLLDESPEAEVPDVPAAELDVFTPLDLGGPAEDAAPEGPGADDADAAAEPAPGFEAAPGTEPEVEAAPEGDAEAPAEE